MFELTKYYITGPFMGMTIKSISTDKVVPGTVTVGPYGKDVYEVKKCRELPAHVVARFFPSHAGA